MPKPYTPNDKWSQRAQRDGYRALSFYKLQEMDEKFRLLKSGMTVLDLGAAPGSWLQYAKEKVGEQGTVLGFDLQEIEPIEEVETIICDITDTDALKGHLVERNIEHVDLILSDLAPKTSGIRDVDQWRSIELSQEVLATADQFLSKGGRCVLKILRGADFDEFLAECKKTWKLAKTFQAKASRDRSKEIYVILTK